MIPSHTHGGTDAPECTTCRPLASGPAEGGSTPLDPPVGEGPVSVRLIGDNEHMAQKLLDASQRLALLHVTEAAEQLRRSEAIYARAVLRAHELGLGATAIGDAAGLSEGAIRGFVRRRKESVA